MLVSIFVTGKWRRRICRRGREFGAGERRGGRREAGEGG